MFRLRHLIKFLSRLILIGLVVIVIALVVLVNFVNPNDYKDKISDLVAAKTGRTLVFGGNVSWRLYPLLAIRAEQVSLSNAKNFPAEGDFASIGEADFSVALLPLLRHVVIIDHLYLKDMQLHLIKSVGGSNNWQDLFGAPHGGASTSAPVVGKKSEAQSAASDNSGEKANVLLPAKALKTERSASLVLAPIVQNIEVKNTTLTWQDHTSGRSLTIDGFNFKGKHISLDAPFYFDLNFNFANHNPFANGSVDLKSTVELDLNRHRYELRDLVLTGLLRDANFAKNLPYTLKADATVDFSAQTLKLENFSVKLANLTLLGAVDGSQIIDAPVLQGNLDGNVKDIQSFLNYFGVRFRADSILPSTLQTRLNFEYTPKFIKVPNLMLSLDDSTITGSFNFTNFTEKSLEFALNVNQINLDKFSKIKVEKASRQSTEPETSFNQINAARSLWNAPVAEANKAQAEVQSQPVPDGKPAMPMVEKTMHPNFKIDGSLSIGALLVQKIKFSSIQCNITGTTRNLMTNLFANLDSGKVRVKASYNGDRKAFATDINLSGINLAQLLPNVSKSGKVSGIANLNATLNSSGDKVDAILQHLNGKGVLSVYNGIWYGIDMRYQVNRANAILNHRPMPDETKPPYTEFGNVTANFTITNGVLNNHDLVMQAPTFYANGAGEINLANQQVHYNLDVKGMRTVTDASGNKSDVPTDWFFPLKISGTMKDLSYSPDYGKLAGQVVKKTATQAIEKALTDRLNINPDVSNKIVKSLRLDQILK